MNAREEFDLFTTAKQENYEHIKELKRFLVEYVRNKDIGKIENTLKNIEILRKANKELNDLINTQSYAVSQERLNSINPEFCIRHVKNGGTCMSDDKYRCNECAYYNVKEGADTE